jgi:CDP-paratose 2-epimerase
MNRVASPALHLVKRHVLVTGGCGFIGTHLANALASRGEHVVVLDNMARKGSEENRAWLMQRHRKTLAVEVADIRDEEAVDSLASRAKAVLHLAGQVAVTTSMDEPKQDFDVNAAGTLNVLEAVRRHNPQSPVIFASTNKVYGRILSDDAVMRRGCRYFPRDEYMAKGVAESAALDLYSPYGCSKGAADQYVRDYARMFGLRTAVLRMSCIYGPRQFGNEDQGWIAHFLIQAICGRPITIYGDGYQVRDALFIDDAVAAWLGALDRIDAIKGRIFNLGGGPANAISLLELLDLMCGMFDRLPPVSHGAWRPGDQPWYVADIRAIAQALDWLPRTPIAEGLAKLQCWLVQRFGEAPQPDIRPIEAQA